MRVYTTPRGGPQIMGVSSAFQPDGDVILKADPSSFLLAFGVHLNILCVIGQLLLMRQELMDSPS